MSRAKSGNAAMRRRFRLFLWKKLQLVWPILGALALVQIALGLFAGLIEHWSLDDWLYFTFVTGLTVGYGDFVPKHLFRGLPRSPSPLTASSSWA